MSKSAFFSQPWADTLKTEIYKPTDIETTALRAQYLDAIGPGFAKENDVKYFWNMDTKIIPENNIAQKFSSWQKHLKKLIQ